MKKQLPTLLFLCALILMSNYCIGCSSIPDSVVVDTINFRDMNDEYKIRRYKVRDKVIQLDIDRIGSYTTIDYILWDMDKNGRMEAIGVYDVLAQKYDYHLIEEDLAADDLLEYTVQLEDIGFPSFYDSSEIPKAIYKSEEHQPELNYIVYKFL